MILYEKIMNDSDIFHKMTYITTDNAFNMLKASSIPGYNQNVVISTNKKTHLSDSESDKDQIVFKILCNILCDNVFDFLPKHDGCFAHILDLL